MARPYGERRLADVSVSPPPYITLDAAPVTPDQLAVLQQLERTGELHLATASAAPGVLAVCNELAASGFAVMRETPGAAGTVISLHLRTLGAAAATLAVRRGVVPSKLDVRGPWS